MPTPRNQRPTNVAYYAKNREREIRRVRDRQDATLRFLRKLRERPCADCGGLFEPHQMDFDHRDPMSKSFNVTTGRAMLMSRARLLEEVAKCDIVCANCHRFRTWEQHKRRLAMNGLLGRSRYIERMRKRWRMHAAVLRRLRDVPCVDCGARFPPCAMDFDHRQPSLKTAVVTQMIGRAGLARILAEAAKCDIVCANCHRERTFRRRSRGRE